MSDALGTFAFGNWTFRYVMKDGQPWFVVVDLCAALGLDSPTKALLGTPDKDRGQTPLRSNQGVYEQVNLTNIVNEPGLWRLIFKSRKPEAEQLKTFVFEEVLPALRKHGYYAMPEAVEQTRVSNLVLPDTLSGWAKVGASLMRALADTTDDLTEVKAELEIARPKAEIHDEWMDESKGVYVRQAAKLLAQVQLAPAKGSEKWLWAFLRDIRWVTKIGKTNTAVPNQIRLGRIREQFGSGYLDDNGVLQPGRATILILPAGLIELRKILITLRDNPLGNVRSIESGDPMTPVELLERLDEG